MTQSGERAQDEPLWRVVCTRTMTQDFYVQAATRKAAIEAAENLTDPTEWVVEDDDYEPLMATEVPEQYGMYWTGGGDGHWADASDIGGST